MTEIMPDHRANYIFAGKLVKKGVTLEVGCASGLGLMLMSKSKDNLLIGLDLDRHYINAAKAKAKDNRILSDFIVADAKHLPVRNQSIDSLLAFELIEHLGHYHLFLDEVRRALKSKNMGVFLLSTPNKLLTSPGQRKPGYRWHEHEFTPDELSKTLLAYFSNVTLYGKMVVSSEWSSIIRSRTLKLRVMKFIPWFIRSHVPQTIKNAFIGEDDFRHFLPENFIFKENYFDQALDLLAVCYN